MKKLFALTAAAVVLFATGCNKEAVSQDGPDAETPSVKVRRTLTAAAPVETRTALGGVDGVEILWQEGDAISVCGEKSERPYTFTLVEGAGTGTATFRGEVDANDDSENFYAVYPAALAVNPAALREGKIELNEALPAVQTAVGGGFDPRAAVLTGFVSSDDKVTFRHGMAYFKLKVGREDVYAIRLESTNACLAGRPVFTVADDGASCRVEDASRSIRLKPASGTFEKDATYYIPVPVIDDSQLDNKLYSLVLTYAYDEAGRNTESIVGRQDKAVERGKVYDLGTPNVADAYPDLALDVVAAEMDRNHSAEYLDYNTENNKVKYPKGYYWKWNYTTGLELKAFLDVLNAYPDHEETNGILSYVDNWYDKWITNGGTNISLDNNTRNNNPGCYSNNYNIDNCVLDHICPGYTLFGLYDITQTEKYQKVLTNVLYAQIKKQSRTNNSPSGGFWHKKDYPDQMWLDGLYMAEPFYAEYTRRYVFNPDERALNFNDIAVNQFKQIYDHTYDAETGLLRHAWDASGSMSTIWSNPVTGQSAHAWGRAMGWYAMALVDVIEILTSEDDAKAAREELVSLLKKVYQGVLNPKWRDRESGMWFQVMDRPYAEGNYVEATASAMFVYSWLKGCRLGILEDVEGARAAYAALVKTFVTTDDDGRIDLNQCCAVAGLGGPENRKGDYAYYIAQEVIKNDPKGIGPLIWAALEYKNRI